MGSITSGHRVEPPTGVGDEEDGMCGNCNLLLAKVPGAKVPGSKGTVPGKDTSWVNDDVRSQQSGPGGALTEDVADLGGEASQQSGESAGGRGSRNPRDEAVKNQKH